MLSLCREKICSVTAWNSDAQTDRSTALLEECGFGVFYSLVALGRSSVVQIVPCRVMAFLAH